MARAVGFEEGPLLILFSCRLGVLDILPLLRLAFGWKALTTGAVILAFIAFLLAPVNLWPAMLVAGGAVLVSFAALNAWWKGKGLPAVKLTQAVSWSGFYSQIRLTGLGRLRHGVSINNEGRRLDLTILGRRSRLLDALDEASTVAYPETWESEPPGKVRS